MRMVKDFLANTGMIQWPYLKNALGAYQRIYLQIL